MTVIREVGKYIVCRPTVC